MGYVYYRGVGVHRLVLYHFNPLGNHPVWMDRVDHINRITDDNRLVNLRWSNSVLNGINSIKAGHFITRDSCYVVQVRVMGQRHACSAHTVQDAIYLVHEANRRTFHGLEVLYKFLAAGDRPMRTHDDGEDVDVGQEYTALPHIKPHAWLSRHFPASFFRRLSGLPCKVHQGRRRSNN